MPTWFYRYLSNPAEMKQLLDERRIQSVNPLTNYLPWYPPARYGNIDLAQRELAMPYTPTHRVGPIPDTHIGSMHVPPRLAWPAHGFPGGGLDRRHLGAWHPHHPNTAASASPGFSGPSATTPRPVRPPPELVCQTHFRGVQVMLRVKAAHDIALIAAQLRAAIDAINRMQLLPITGIDPDLWPRFRGRPTQGDTDAAPRPHRQTCSSRPWFARVAMHGFLYGCQR